MIPPLIPYTGWLKIHPVKYSTTNQFLNSAGNLKSYTTGDAFINSNNSQPWAPGMCYRNTHNHLIPVNVDGLNTRKDIDMPPLRGSKDLNFMCSTLATDMPPRWGWVVVVRDHQ